MARKPTKKTMLGFVDSDKEMPDKRKAGERRHDFAEIYDEFDDAQAEDQANRCSQCGVPFCQVHCPLNNNIPDWLMLTAEGRLEEAYEVSSATNTFPEICGRICPQDRLCEGLCTIEQSGHGTVTIGAIEKFITETAFENGWVKPRKPVKDRAESIGIIGAGPGGLAAAEMLRAMGYAVHVYDRYDRVGGLLVYGIPNFKLDKHIVKRREDLLREQGVEFHLNFEVGKDAKLADLRKKHAAILIATGVYKPRALQVPGVGLDNVVQAIDYLTASNRKGFGDDVPEFDSGALDAEGKHVVVIGGGDTAMDCVRTAVRQGAKSVKCLYRRDRKNMPGSQREVANAEEEGVDFEWLSAPLALKGGKAKASKEKGAGPVTAVKVQQMHLGVPDASGRQTPQPIAGAETDIKADLVIKALGFEPEDLPKMFGEKDLPVTRWGTLVVDPATQMTGVEGVFAAGDIVRGASLVVWAIRDGRDAAAAMHDYIQTQKGAGAAPLAAE